MNVLIEEYHWKAVIANSREDQQDDDIEFVSVRRVLDVPPRCVRPIHDLCSRLTDHLCSLATSSNQGTNTRRWLLATPSKRSSRTHRWRPKPRPSGSAGKYHTAVFSFHSNTPTQHVRSPFPGACCVRVQHQSRGRPSQPQRWPGPRSGSRARSGYPRARPNRGWYQRRGGSPREQSSP